jgi:hypothetical protein
MLTDLKVGRDDRGLYVSAEYLYKSGYSTKKLTIPKIRVDKLSGCPTLTNTADGVFIQVDYARLPLERDDDEMFYSVTTIEGEPRRMTLSEIEKELGYKVELVSEYGLVSDKRGE